MLRIYSIERRQKWGEKRKGDRIGEEEGGRGTGKTMNTQGKNNVTGNQFFIKKHLLFVAYRFRFIEMKTGKLWRGVASR